MKRLEGFMEFIREQGVVGLAIGFMMGGAVSKLVSAFVNDIINPIVSAIFGNIESIKEASISLGGRSEILWGDFVVVMVDFVIISAVVYFLFRGLRLEKIDKKKKKKE